MSVRRVESHLEDLVARTPLGQLVEPTRVVQFLEFLTVGLSGAVIDITITVLALEYAHYLAANAAGFLVANTWNYNLNRRVTFAASSGAIVREYPAYLGWHSGTFAVRALVLSLLVETAGVPILVASVVGIAAASIANFLGAEVIFGASSASPAQLRVATGRALNRLVHTLYTSRVRDTIDRLGLYAPLYGTYQRVLGHLYPHDERTIVVHDATARVHMERDAEVLSILHTLRKEREMLEDFVASIEPDDVVWDVGANLGVFSLLAADQDGVDVVAFEPYWPTADRLEENTALSDVDVDVHELALGREEDTVALGIDRRELGTQTPTVDPRDGQRTTPVAMFPGDDLVESGYSPPDVLKVDVEGAERDVLDGLEDTLTRRECRLVYVEDHSGLWGGRDAHRELCQRLEALGFTVDVEQRRGQTYVRAENDQ